MKEEETLGRRKEPRYKTDDEQTLHCDCFYHEDDPKHGSVIDVSASGLRFLCEGSFQVGQTILIELKTDRSHGAYGGIIRRVEPWVGGQSVLGCELIETLTDDVLEDLAQEGVVNRRRDDRVDWNQPAKMSWELQPGEIDVQIHDCSTDGLKVSSQVAIPENIRLRIRVDREGEEELVIDAKTVWQQQQDDQCLAGLAFNDKEVPDAVTEILAKANSEAEPTTVTNRRTSIRPGLMIAAAIVLLGVTMLQTGWLQ